MAKYDATQENLILGDELFLYVNTKGSGETYSPMAFATSCSLNLSADSIDTSNKMAGVWASALPGKLSWTISTEALMSYDETGYGYLFDCLKNRKPILVKFGQVTKSESTETGLDADYAMDTQKTYYSGKAYVTSCNLSADNGSVATMSIELTGNGPLAKTAAGVGA